MKRFVIASAILAGLPWAAAQTDPRLRTVIYSPDVIVPVPVRRGVVTQIVLPEDETIVGEPMPGTGSDCKAEGHRWCIVGSGHDIFVKPRTGATSNNLMVVTTKRRHAFELVAAEEPGAIPVKGHARLRPEATVMRLQVVLPPPPIASAPAQPMVRAPTAEELVKNRLRAEPLVRNSNYSVAEGENSADIVPAMVWDDGTMTYLAFPNNRPLPAIFETLPDGVEVSVNAQMLPDDADHPGRGLVAVDHVTRRLVLRMGTTMVVSIINEAFDIDGVPPKNGTTVPGVARVIRTSAPTAGVTQ